MLHHPDKDNLMLSGSLRTRKARAERKREHKEFWENLEENIDGSKDVKRLLLMAISEVKSGELSPKQASNISSLSGHLIKTIEVSQLEARMQYLEGKYRENEDRKSRVAKSRGA